MTFEQYMNALVSRFGAALVLEVLLEQLPLGTRFPLAENVAMELDYNPCNLGSFV